MDFIKPEPESDGDSYSAPSYNESWLPDIKAEDPLLIRFPVMKTENEVSLIPACSLLNIVPLAVFMISALESLTSESYFFCNCCMLNIGFSAICASYFNHADTKIFYPTCETPSFIPLSLTIFCYMHLFNYGQMFQMF
jgi:hypothetical protein